MWVPLEGAAALAWPALALLAALAATVIITRLQSSRLAPAGADARGGEPDPAAAGRAQPPRLAGAVSLECFARKLGGDRHLECAPAAG